MTPDDVARDGLGDRTTVRLPPDQWDHWYRAGHPTVNSRKETDLFYGHVASEVGMRAVDLACGNGQWTRQLTSWGLTVRGFDFAPEALKQAAAAGSRKRPHVRALGHRRRAHPLRPASGDGRRGDLPLRTPVSPVRALLTDVGRWLRPAGAFYALVYVAHENWNRKSRSDPFHRGFTEEEIQALGSGWAFRRTNSLSQSQRAVVLCGYG